MSERTLDPFAFIRHNRLWIVALAIIGIINGVLAVL
jgi:hypothetical protein